MQRITQRMSQGNTQGTISDRLGLTDLLEISDLLLRSQTFRFRVTSWSMSPALRKGDRLTVEPVSPAQLQVGDLILFHHRGRLICHRLVAVQENGAGPRLITRGDATAGCDAPLQADQVLGRVVAVKRSGLRIGSLALRVDRWREQITDRVAQALLRLQGFRPYRQIMRGLVSRGFEYSIGVPEGRRWYRYERLCRDRGAPGLNSNHGFHLLAKLAGSTVASLHAVRRGEDYWLEAFYVRLRYRGLGVASQLLMIACHLASRNGARRFLATVEAENSAALSLLDKMGFRSLTGSEPDGTAVLYRDLPR